MLLAGEIGDGDTVEVLAQDGHLTLSGSRLAKAA
jgi:hypothetical protein